MVKCCTKSWWATERDRATQERGNMFLLKMKHDDKMPASHSGEIFTYHIIYVHFIHTLLSSSFASLSLSLSLFLSCSFSLPLSLSVSFSLFLQDKLSIVTTTTVCWFESLSILTKCQQFDWISAIIWTEFFRSSLFKKKFSLSCSLLHHYTHGHRHFVQMHRNNSLNNNAEKKEKKNIQTNGARKKRNEKKG